MSPGVATPWPAAPPIPIAKVCFITPSLTECRPVHEALALGRAQIIACIPVRGTPCPKLQLGLGSGSIHRISPDVLGVQEIGSGSVSDLHVIRRDEWSGTTARCEMASYLEPRQFLSSGSPLVVRNAVAVDLTRSRMNVNHPSARLLRAQHNDVELRHPVFFPRKWVGRNLLQIMPVHQGSQGLRCLLLIQRVFIDSLPHHH